MSSNVGLTNSQLFNIGQINSVFATEKKEKDRTTFNETFFEINLNSNSENSNTTDADKFIGGLKDNKELLCKKLNINPDLYDSLSCIALAIASQETGMGLENGYDRENKGIGKAWRDFCKFFDADIGHNGSASSGITQMKIYDLMTEVLDENSVEILKECGIKINGHTPGTSSNNLYLEPDKAAIATIVVLSDIAKHYPEYTEALKDGHLKIKDSLDSNMSDEDCINKGNEIIDSIRSVYDNSNHDKQEAIRNALKNWVLSNNGSKDTLFYRIKHPIQGMKYNEEYQLKTLNKLLNNSGINIKQDDLNYIRYALSDDGCEMTMSQYCAYGWNNGTGYESKQLDRMIRGKIETIFTNPEDFNYEQYTINVDNLTSRYAQKSGASLETINELLQDYLE